MDLSDLIKNTFREMRKTTKVLSKADKQEKRKSIRANELIARRNIDVGMSPFCTPLAEKRDLPKAPPKRAPSAAVANRLKLLAQWKANKAKEKLEKAKVKQKPLFVVHTGTSLSVNLENVNKMIKGQLIKKSQFAPENHKFRAPSGVKPVEFRYHSNLSKALNNASKPSTKFQKSSYRSESIRNKNTVDGIGQNNVVKSTSSLASSTNINTRSTMLKPAEGSRNHKEPEKSTKVTDKPGPSAYNTRANIRAKIGSTSTSRLEQNQSRSTPKSAPIQHKKYVTDSNNPIKLESKALKSSSVKKIQSQTTPKTYSRNKSKPTPTSTYQGRNMTKSTPNFVAQNVKSVSSASSRSKLGLNAPKTNTSNKSRIQTTPMTVTGLKSKLKLTSTSKGKVTPTTSSGLKSNPKPVSSSKIILPKNSKSKVTPKIDTGLRLGVSCNKITTRTPRLREDTPKVTLNIPKSHDLKLDYGDVLAEKTPENIKETNAELLGTPAYISPFVTISRGKRSAIDEYKTRKSLNKDINKTATPQKSTLTSVQAGANYFMAKLDSQIAKINAKCNEWEIYLQDPELPEEAQSSISVTIGQSKLLISKKFQQFRGLINQCITQNYEEKEITCEDLHGFWDMIYMQVENLDTRFEYLHKLKDNNWSEMLPEKVEVVKKPKEPAKKTKAKKPAPKTRTGLKDMIKAARAKQKSDIEEENVFNGGYFEVRTPVKARKNTPRCSTNKRKSKLLELKSESTSSFSISPSGLTLMKLSQSIKQNNGLTPSKGILKVSARKSTGLKKVVFEDTINSKNIRKAVLFTNENGESSDGGDGKTTTFKEDNKENTPVRRSSRLRSQAHE